MEQYIFRTIYVCTVWDDYGSFAEIHVFDDEQGWYWLIKDHAWEVVR
jgi:hypothetical protein